MGAGIEPGIAAPHTFDVEETFIEVELQQVGDFQFAAW